MAEAKGRNMANIVTYFRNVDVHYAVSRAYEDFKFGCLKIGKFCNVGSGASFVTANCDLKPLSVSGTTKGGETKDIVVKFQYLFRFGFDLMYDLFKGNRKFEDIEGHHQKALHILKGFLDNKEFHSKCLDKILKNTEKLAEIDVTIALSEHLLGKLSPGQSYVIDKKCEDKPKHCKCGCNADINYGDTGIGHERVWHGFLDIVLPSHEGILEDTDAVAVREPMPKRLKKGDGSESDDSEEEEKEEKEVNRDKSCGTEVNVFFNDNNVENQSSAQAIIFSLLQKSRHPDFRHHVIPTIVISPTSFRIIMYDADHDILLRSDLIYIFQPVRPDDTGPPALTNYAIVVLWMILHYRIFGSEIDMKDMKFDIKANFSEFTLENVNVFKNELKSCVASFPKVEQNSLGDYVTMGLLCCAHDSGQKSFI